MPSTLIDPCRAGNIRVLAGSCFCTRLESAADRAFGAQRFSGGRSGRRFAPPSAGLRGGASGGTIAPLLLHALFFHVAVGLQTSLASPLLVNSNHLFRCGRKLSGPMEIWWLQKEAIKIVTASGARFRGLEAHLEHFRGQGPDMPRMILRSLTLSTLATWAQIWPELG